MAQASKTFRDETGYLDKDKKDKTPIRQKNILKKSILSVSGVLMLLIFLYLGAFFMPYAFVPKITDTQAALGLFKPMLIKGNRACILVDGEEAFDARISMIANAKSSIIISTYLFQNDESGCRVASALMAAADRGVSVRILMDGFVGKVHLEESNLAYLLSTYPNIALRFYNPINLLAPDKINARHHEKFMIADEELIIFGGRNISDEFLTEKEHPVYNDDLDVLIFSQNLFDANPAVIMAGHFDRMWEDLSFPMYTSVPLNQIETVRDFEQRLRQEYAALQSQRPDLMLPSDWALHTVPIEGFAILKNPTEIGIKEPYLWVSLIQLMKESKDRVWIQTPYIVLSRDMKKDLTDVAENPQELKILINSRASGNNLFASADYLFQQRKLKRMEMSLYEYQGDNSMHTKAVLIDSDISIFGSFNMDTRSAYLNTETMLVVYGEAINHQLEKQMRDKLNTAVCVNSAEQETVNLDYHLKDIDSRKNKKIHLMAPFVWLFRFVV